MTDLRTSLGPIRHLSRHSRWCAALLALAVLLAAVTSSAQPPTGQPYTFTVLEASPTGCCTSPKAINNVGGVIGDYHVDPDGPSHSFIWNVDFYGLFDLPFGASGGIIRFLEMPFGCTDPASPLMLILTSTRSGH